MKADFHIVSTKILNPVLVQRIKSAGIALSQADFIAKHIFMPDNLDVSALGQTILLASKTAVEAWVAIIDKYKLDRKKYRVYCLSGATRVLAKEYNLCIEGTADHATDLAVAVLRDKSLKEVVLVCGNLRRDELPDALKANGIHVMEIIAYTTRPVPVRIEPPYEGILFFSPSAADSFLSLNPVGGAAAFCLGATTAGHCRQLGFSEILVAEKHTPESLVDKLIHYYKQQSEHA